MHPTALPTNADQPNDPPSPLDIARAVIDTEQPIAALLTISP